MAAAGLLLGLVTIATLASISSGQSSSAIMAQCRPCPKMMNKVCAEDKDGSLKTFANPCLIQFCNCVLNLTKVNRVFMQTHEGDCNGTETAIPQCFPDTGSSSVSPPVGNVTASVSEAPTAAPTAGGRSTNTTTEAPSGADSVFKTVFLTLALPLAAISIFL